MNIDEFERIRSQAISEDWSAGIIELASLDDLDEKAISVARENYKSKFPSKASEVDTWDDIAFLNKAKLTIKGKITRTAIILLGKEESEHFINPAEAKIREAINNCIAHQDYTKGGRINVIEMEDQLVFTNLGSFIPGSVEKVVKDDAPEEHYRNKFLASAMFNLKMVDTAGGGIRKMFLFQRERFFPLPDYDLSAGKVKVTITGKVLDLEYARMLARHNELSLDEIIMLDKVQKKINLTEGEEKYLRDHSLIEGRKPNYYISRGVAQKTGQKAAYSKNRAFDKAYYCDLIIKAISEHRFLERNDVDELLWKKLPEWMNDKQRKVKINNLLSELRTKNRIKNTGSDAKPRWVLTELIS